MATTYTLISSVTVGSGGAATMSFSSIPSTYTDLKLVVSARSTSNADPSTAPWDTFYVTINNQSAASDIYLAGTGSATVSSNDSYVYGGAAAGSSSTSSTFGNNEIYFPNYTSTNNKSVSVDGVSENNATAAVTFLVAGLFTTSTAINTITLTLFNGNFVQYSTAYLYGISNA
jgi:hypothetical protein